MQLQEIPKDDILEELSKRIGHCAIHLGIELGLDMINIEETLCRHSKDMFGQNCDILKKWIRDKRTTNKTIRFLMKTLCIVDSRGFSFLRKKYGIPLRGDC